jgi:hypothetical protein
MTVEGLALTLDVVIASDSEAIQNNEESWIASAFAKRLRRTGRRFAPRNDGWTYLRILATASARGLQIRSPLKREAQCDPKRDAGKTGCALHPRSHVQG